MFYSDDPAKDYDSYCLEQQKRLEKLPKCSECGEHIDSDYYYDIDGVLHCEDCIEGHRKWTEDYID
jgi:formylmethanofuran dehydrogenase subunit E